MTGVEILVQNFVPFVLYIFAILGAIVCLMQKDLLRMAILTSVTGFMLAAIYQVLLAPDVALTQAVVGAAIVPTLVALTILKTREEPVIEDDGQVMHNGNRSSSMWIINYRSTFNDYRFSSISLLR
jgi:energy-converting hydrogenase B subunit D